MNDKQLNEGIREIVLTMLSLVATTYETNYVLKLLDKRPEPIHQKIEALEIVGDKNINPEFDKTIDDLLQHYSNKAVLVKPKNIYDTNVSAKLLNFVKKHEQFSPTPYWDYKQYSIGYGTKALPTDKKISESEAANRLIKTIKSHRDSVIADAKRWKYKWTPTQINALTSFRYNVGSLNKLTNNGTRNSKVIAKKILEYDKAGGKSLPGLTKRRMDEYKMFISN